MKDIRNYSDAVSYISSIPRFADKNDFIYMEAFYRYMNLENAGCKVFHVAGTNGKGSTCAYIASMCRAMGKSVGMFTSPHLVDVRERILLDDRMISEDEFYNAFMQVYEKYQSFIEDERYKTYIPTYFAWFFFVAAAFYHEAGPDVIVWETGLGGKLDATNTLLHKDVCIITEIGLDHMEYLGDTIDKIAAEKAGILRAGIPVVMADRDNAATAVIQTAAKTLGNKVYPVSKKTIKTEVLGRKGIDFWYKSRYYGNVKFTLGSLGSYQPENASLALTAMELAYGKDELTYEIMSDGLAAMSWSGRMEIIEPGVVFDGAHNVDGIEALLESVKSDGCMGKRYMLFSAVTDKQASVMMSMIEASSLFDCIAVAHIDNSRGTPIEELAELVKDIQGSRIYGDVYEAYDELRQMLKDEDMLYVCGSLYLIAELKKRIS